MFLERTFVPRLKLFLDALRLIFDRFLIVLSFSVFGVSAHI